MKMKQVTYQPSMIDENSDYLVPLQYQYHPTLTIQPKKIKSTIPPASPQSSILSSIYFPVSLLLYLAIPIAQLIIGFLYFGQCRVQPLIVIWMIVSGFVGMFLVLLGVLIHRPMQRQSMSLSPPNGFLTYPLIVKILLPIFILVLLFVIAWFFAGQVFVFGVKLRVEFFDPSLPEYCHGNLYKAAYILIFIDYLVFFLAIILNVLSFIAPPEETSTNKSRKKRPSIRTTRI